MTALNSHIGYEKAAKISLTADHEDLSLREAALKLGFLTAPRGDDTPSLRKSAGEDGR